MTHRIPARMTSIGEFDVRRVLPHHTLRKVGPWVFVDHFGPHARAVSRASDVLPHPPCGISTVSYLFEGGIEHRDSTALIAKRDAIPTQLAADRLGDQRLAEGRG